jgi:DNA-binding transcriptional ArsR family regulator
MFISSFKEKALDEKERVAGNKALSTIEGYIPEQELLHKLAGFFGVFSDPTRMKILFVLFHDELCVNDIASVCSMNQSAVSHQLRILKQEHLVRYRKHGKAVYYSLSDDHVKKIVHQGLTHIQER